jgi:outer membrane lipoprotein SlyB
MGNFESRSTAQKLLLAVLASTAFLGGCASSSPDTITRNQAMRTQYAMTGTIESTRQMQIEGNQSGVGAVTGTVIGGIAGSSVGHKRANIAVGVLGAVLGGVAGNAIEKYATGENAVEMVVQLTNGSRIAIVQAAGSQGLMPGDRVNLIGSPGAYRVTRNNG